MIRTRTSVCIVAVALAGAVAALSGAQDTRVSRAIPAGATVELDLSAGEYTIVAGTDRRVQVEWETRPGDADKVDVDIDVRGNKAIVETDGPLNSTFKVRIELPRRTDVVVNLSAGELTISGIEGSKDIAARAGELNIETGSSDQYRRVDASVRIGELKAEAFDVQKGGFFRSFTWNGRGNYDLRARLTVGELNLTR